MYMHDLMHMELCKNDYYIFHMEEMCMQKLCSHVLRKLMVNIFCN